LKEAAAVRGAVNRHAWDGKWYIRGTTDEGRAFGSARDKEGRIWLNAQTWAIIAGIANGGRRETLMQQIEKHLMTPSGPMLNAPAYTRFDGTIGKVTIKNPGIDENASVYNSAVAWCAYAMYKARLADDAWKYLRVMLTGAGGNTIKRSGQLPLYIPNFYKGPAVGRDAGETSHSPSTGTIAWFNHLVVTCLLGLGGEWEGLRVDPQLPRGWKEIHVLRRFRGAEFDVVMRRSRAAKATRVTLDGRGVRGSLIPVQAKGSRHRVEVTLPG
jgi:cellobionic acid phosphorylase